MATGISLGVPHLEISLSSSGKRDGPLRDALAAAPGFAGLVETLTPGSEPGVANAGRAPGRGGPSGVEPRPPFDSPALGQWFEQAEAAGAAVSATQAEAADAAHGADPGPASPDDPSSSDAAAVDRAQVTPTALGLGLAIVQQLPPLPDVPTCTSVVEVDAPNGTSSPAAEVPSDVPPCGQRGHGGHVGSVGCGLAVSLALAPTVAGDRRSENAASAHAPRVDPSLDRLERSNAAPTEEPPSDALPPRVLDRGVDPARGHHHEPHAAVATPRADEARATATAELRRALSRQAVATRATIPSDLSTREADQTSESPTFRDLGSDASVPPQGALGAEFPTTGSGDGSGHEHGNGRQDSGADLFSGRERSSRQGGLGTAGPSVTAESFPLRDLPSFGARSMVSTQEPSGDSAPDLPQQVVRAVHMQWRQGIGEARLQLHPQHLGHLTVLLRVEGGTVTAVLRTESRLALERIEANQQELRAALEQQGLRLDRLVVAVDPDARGRRQPSAPPFAGRHYSRPTDGQPLFDLNDVASE